MTSATSQDPRVLRNRAVVNAAALRLLADEGLSGLSIERLAEQSGVSRSTIYRNWPDLRALVLTAFDDLVHTMSPQRTPSGDFDADLMAYLRDYARRLNDPSYTAVIIAIIEWSWRDREFAEEHGRIFDDTRSRAAGILRDALASGRVRPDLNIGEGVEQIVAPFLYRRLVLRRVLSSRDIEALHCRLLEQLAPGPRGDTDPARDGAAHP